MFKALLFVAALAFACGVSAAPPPLDDAQDKFMRSIGAKLDVDGNVELDGIVVDRELREVSFPAYVNLSRGQLELVVCSPLGRRHESLLLAEINPLKLQLALILLGLKNGAAAERADVPRGAALHLDVELPGGRREPVENWMRDDTAHAPMPRTAWVFVGSGFAPDRRCLAEASGNIVDINSMDMDTILAAPATDHFKKSVFAVDSARVERGLGIVADNQTPDAFRRFPVKVHLRPAP